MKVKIIDYDHQGRGIAKVYNKVIFIPKVKRGEDVSIKLVKEKKNYSIGKRCDHLKVKYCPYYQTCGGCQIGHLTYDEQLEFKKNTVKNIFSKYTNYNLENIEILKTKRYNYRNKVTFHIKENKLGYYEEETNNLIPIDKCNLLDSDIITLTASLNCFIKVHKKLTKAIIKSLDGKLMLILEGKESKESINEFFSSTVSSLYYNNELISGVPSLMMNVLSKKFMVRKDSFFQVNKEGISLIYKEVINLVKELTCNIIYDLYCGTGTISLLVSDYAKKVVGIEVVEDAVRDAKSNVKLNNITNTEFYLGDVSKVIDKLNYTPDTIILDPPRSGISKDLIEILLSLKVKNIIYVSCNPLTLARDINLLDSNYSLKSIKLVDEFPNTYHLESITLLKKVNKRQEEKNMNFIIKEGNINDINEVVDAIKYLHDIIENKEWYAIGLADYDKILNKLNDEAIVVKALYNGDLAGFLIVERHINPNHELAEEIPKDELSSSIEMDNAGVLPKYRGNHLQESLIIKAESIMKERDSSIKYSYATVHPDNLPSLKTLEKAGYKKYKEKLMYGGKIRYIMRKELV